MEQTQKLVEKMIQYLEMAEGFVKTEAPDLIQQYLTYEAWASERTMYIGIAMIVIGVIAIYLCIALYEFNEGASIAIGIFSTGLLFVGLIIAPCEYFNLKKIEMAPKVVVLDYLKGTKR